MPNGAQTPTEEEKGSGGESPEEWDSDADDDDEGDDEEGGESLPLVPKKDRTGLIPRGSAPVPRRSAGAPPAPALLEADPCNRLSGFKYGRRLLEPAGDDL